MAHGELQPIDRPKFHPFRDWLPSLLIILTIGSAKLACDACQPFLGWWGGLGVGFVVAMLVS